MTGLGELAGLAAACAWAATGLLVRAHGLGLSAVTINALRCTIAGAFFVLAWPLAANHSPVPARAWVLLLTSLVMGLGVGDSLYFEALKRIGVARAMPISMGYPVLAAIGAVVLYQEQIGLRSAVGVVLTLGGVYLVARPTEQADTPAESGYWRGVGLAAGAAVSWSCSTLALQPALALVDVPTASAIRLPLVSALLWVFAARRGALPERASLSRRSLIAIAVTGVMTILATWFFLQSVALAGAGRAAVLTATSPLFAVPISIVFLGERGHGRLMIGTLCSVAGVILLAEP